MSSIVRITSPVGGLVIVGSEISGSAAVRDGLSNNAVIESVEADSSRLADWNSWQAEVALVTRHTSAVLRAGNAALVSVGSHEGADVALSSEERESVSKAMGRVLRYVADCPAYLAILGSETAQVMFAGSNAEVDVSTTGTLDADVPLRELGPSTMFPGMPLAICPAAGGVAVLAEVVKQLEECRF